MVAVPPIGDITSQCTDEEISEIIREALVRRSGPNIVEPYDPAKAVPGALPGAACVEHVAGTSRWDVHVGLEKQALTLATTARARGQIEDIVGRWLDGIFDELRDNERRRRTSAEMTKDVDATIDVLVNAAANMHRKMTQKKLPMKELDPTLLTIAAVAIAARLR